LQEKFEKKFRRILEKLEKTCRKILEKLKGEVHSAEKKRIRTRFFVRHVFLIENDEKNFF